MKVELGFRERSNTEGHRKGEISSCEACCALNSKFVVVCAVAVGVVAEVGIYRLVELVR